jgi:hypothetical protein
MQTGSVKWDGTVAPKGSNTQFMVWLTTLIFTVTTGEEHIVKHTTLVSRENIQLQVINFLPALSSCHCFHAHSSAGSYYGV